MWNITSSELELAREELKGRRAAVEARYAKDLQGLDADLAEIETLERAAAAFSLKHKTEAEQGAATTEAESKTASEMPAVAAHATDRAGRPAEASRWRLSLGDRSSTTQV
jgi:citrate synthase